MHAFGSIFGTLRFRMVHRSLLSVHLVARAPCLKKQRKKPITPLFPASSAPATAVEDQNPLIIIHKAAIHFNPKLFSRIASVFTFAGRKNGRIGITASILETASTTKAGRGCWPYHI